MSKSKKAASSGCFFVDSSPRSPLFRFVVPGMKWHDGFGHFSFQGAAEVVHRFFRVPQLVKAGDVINRFALIDQR